MYGWITPTPSPSSASPSPTGSASGQFGTFTDANCFGANDGKAWAIPSGGQPPFNIVWNTNPPQYTDTAYNLAPGFYEVTLTDANNCSDQFTFIINEPTQLTATSSTTNVSCNGLSDGSIALTVNGGIPPYSYLWSDGNTNATNSGIATGTYSVDITDLNGCSISLNNIIVSEPAALSLVATPDSVLCYGGFDGSIDLAVSGGTQPYAFRWSNNRVNQNLTFIRNKREQMISVPQEGGQNQKETLVADIKLMNEYEVVIKGKDQQLEAAVNELMKEIGR